MKITRAGTTVIDSDESERRWKLREVKPGQVFRFAAGNEKNLYIMGAGRTYFGLNQDTVYGCENEMKGNAAIVIYPDATLELGDESALRPIEEPK